MNVDIEIRKAAGFGHRLCRVEGCEKHFYGRGFCNMHWQRVYKLGWDAETMQPPPKRPYPKRKSVKVTCTAEGCTEAAGARSNLCSLHLARRRERPHMFNSPRRGTTPKKCKSGYLMWWNPVRRHYEFEHRIVMEKIIGRPLLPEETVHHVNGIRHDNSPANLELWTNSHPKGQRVQDIVAWAKSVLTLYGENINAI